MCCHCLYTASSLRRWLLAIVFVTLGAGVAGAQEYSIYSKVLALGNPRPLASSLTLFKDGVGYDFPKGNQSEIVVIDPQTQRITLIDARPGAGQQSIVEMKMLGAFVEQYRKQGMQSNNPDVRQMFDPQLNIQQQGDQIVAGNASVIYEAKGVKPPQAEIAGQYLRFLNWSARLNATDAGSMPPFARIQLNVALDKSGLVPTQIKRTIKRNGKNYTLRSTHDAAWSLTAAEKKKIAEVQKMMAELPSVPFLKFRAAQRMANLPLEAESKR